MSQRYFNNTTTIGTLTGPIASSAVSIGVTNFNQYPTAPFTVTVDRNTPTEEVCLVTAISGGTLTVVRGYDGTAGQAHSAGATIEHTAGAIEYSEANQHNNATSGVHGVTGALVGNQGTQTIYDKTLVSPVVQADVTKGDAVVAVIPAGAGVRNLFRGVGTDGNNKIVVDASGNLTAAGVALTTLNTTVAGHTTSINSNTTNITTNTNSISSLTTTVNGKATTAYVDSQDTATLNSAKSYADTQLVTAKAYTDSAVSALGSRVYFAGWASAGQTIADGSEITVLWDDQVDASNTHAAGAAAFVAPVTGYYRAQATVSFAASVPGVRHVLLRANGVNLQGTAKVQPSGTSLYAMPVATPTRRVYLTAGQTIDVRAGIDGVGASLSVTSGGGAYASMFEVTWDGA